MVLVLVADRDLILPALVEPCLYFLSGLFMVFYLLKPVDVRLMVNKVETLT